MEINLWETCLHQLSFMGYNIYILIETPLMQLQVKYTSNGIRSLSKNIYGDYQWSIHIYLVYQAKLKCSINVGLFIASKSLYHDYTW